MTRKMLVFTFLYYVINSQLANAADHAYTAYKHVNTGRYLDSSGYTSCKLYLNDELFDPVTVGRRQTVLYANPWRNTSNPVVLDIKGGCILNANVIKYSYSEGAKNQIWIMNSDSTIGTACNDKWRLLITDQGEMVVKDKDSVQFEDTVFSTSKSYKITPSQGYFDGQSDGCRH